MKDNPVVYVVMSEYKGDVSLEEIFIQRSEAEHYIQLYRRYNWKYWIEEKQTQ